MYSKDECWPSRKCKYKIARETGTGGSEFKVDLWMFSNDTYNKEPHWLRENRGCGSIHRMQLPVWLAWVLFVALKTTIHSLLPRWTARSSFTDFCQMKHSHLFTYFDLINSLIQHPAANVDLTQRHSSIHCCSFLPNNVLFPIFLLCLKGAPPSIG